MEEQKNELTVPEWLKMATVWQKEDPQNHSVVLVAADGLNAAGGCGGNTLAIENAIIGIMSKEANFRKCIERAVEAINDPAMAMAFGAAVHHFAKEKGYLK